MIFREVPLVTSLLHVGDIPNATPPQHWRRVHDPRHQAGQQGHGGGRARDPGQGGDVIYSLSAHNQPQIINNSKNISSIHYVTHCVFVR